ncbi:hypothetical protein C8E17_4580 [Serratia plymuthica]|uniref:Uncharacterized protein n=1 Tax=Serratia plymuthica TaxID=82996 RepID=A0A2X4UJ78_SERPL|nr:hypothetical protein C8E17_4580 [Serratia plymuthica]CAI2432564.1 Uncharacterised protein [Serratia plymuthica]SQI39917.1 Uncharacterised protein [Serratia plymuthica]
MKSYLLQGNVIKLLRLSYPQYEGIKEETWRALIKIESIWNLDEQVLVYT